MVPPIDGNAIKIPPFPIRIVGAFFTPCYAATVTTTIVCVVNCKYLIIPLIKIIITYFLFEAPSITLHSFICTERGFELFQFTTFNLDVVNFVLLFKRYYQASWTRAHTHCSVCYVVLAPPRIYDVTLLHVLAINLRNINYFIIMLPLSSLFRIPLMCQCLYTNLTNSGCVLLFIFNPRCSYIPIPPPRILPYTTPLQGIERSGGCRLPPMTRKRGNPVKIITAGCSYDCVHIQAYKVEPAIWTK